MADALAAANAGADAVGLVFCRPSPRCIEAGRAREIVEALPPWVTPVGLFVNDSVDQVRSTAAAAGLIYVQLHGNESPEYVTALPHLRVLKAMHVKPGTATELARWRETRLAGLLLETNSDVAGGSGIENDWNAIERLQTGGATRGLPPIILAGGLNPSNVGDVVRRLRPYAVDVSSGIEQSKGVKSIEKMQAFAAAVRAADIG